MSAEGHIVGRDREVAAIVDRLQAGISTVIVGEAGVGKTAVATEVRARLEAHGRTTQLIACGDWGTATFTASATDLIGAAAVIVDDAHLLDAQSAQLLSGLIAASRTAVVATARSGDRPLHSMGWLWAAGACERLELHPLPSEDVRRLLDQQLGDEVDDQLAQLLTERTRGNPLLLRELVRVGVRSGALRRQRGVWRLTGELPLPGAVVDMIRTTLAGLDQKAFEALQMIALAQPLHLGLAERVTATTVLEDLESRQLVLVTNEADGPALSCAHPLYGEVLRGDLGPLRSRRLRGRLLEVMRSDSALPDRARLLAVSWRLDLDEGVEVDELLAGARLSATSNPALAERLLRAVLDQAVDRADGAGADAVEAASTLARLLVIQGRVAEADHVVNQVERVPGPAGTAGAAAEQREQLATVRVLVRTRLGEITEALRLVGAAPDDTPGQPVSLQTQALYAQLMLLSARLDETLRITDPITTDPSDTVARGVAAYTGVAAQSFTGQIDATERALQQAVPILVAAREELPYGIALAQVSTAIGQILAGHFGAAARLGQRMHDSAEQADDPWLRPRSATVFGLLALYRGQPDTAAAHLRTAVASLTPLDTMFVRYNLAFLARAAALAGNLTDAEQALRPPTDAPRFPLYEADGQIAEAAVLAAQFRLDEAAQRAMTAARTAAAHGQWGIAAVAAHDAARYTGDPDAATFLTTVTDLVDGPLPVLMREHAAARAAHDPGRLHAVSLQFERLGAMGFAAEAAYAGVRDLPRDADRSTVAQRAAHAIELHSRCRQVFAPWAVGRAVDGLTLRERQVALLAASGHADRQIGTQLDISIRTVQTHLTRVYSKLHVGTRGDLPTALTSPGGRRDPTKDARLAP